MNSYVEYHLSTLTFSIYYEIAIGTMIAIDINLLL